MEHVKGRRPIIVIWVLLFLTDNRAGAQINEASACHGTQKVECDFFSMTCDTGTKIRITDMMYGYKDYSCTENRNRCKMRSRNGCCAYNDEDCFEKYTSLHAYNLHRDCSMLEMCGEFQAPNHFLSMCGNQLSTYVYMTYECVSFADQDDVSIGFCDNRTIYPIDKKASIIFQSETNDFVGDSCKCRITTLLSNIKITFVDIRLFKENTGTGNRCASAKLSSNNGDRFECSSSLTQFEDNFVYNRTSFSGEQVELALTDLYKLGPDDVPSLIWILVEGAIKIECGSSLPPETTTKPTTERTNTTGDINSAPSNDTEGSNAGVIAGAVAGVLIVIIIIGVTVFIMCRRRKSKPRKKLARQNSYTGAPSIRSNIYDEINDTGPEIIYDPVYEPRKSDSDHVNDTKYKNGATGPSQNTLAKTHTYQNVGKGIQSADSNSNTKEKSSIIPQRLKVPFSKVKKQTNRFVDFIKSRKGDEQANTKKRPREESGGSYDHLRIGAPQPQISPPINEPKHAYSHAAGPQKHNETSNLTDDAKANQQKVEKVPSDYDLQAVHVGDQYIEFQFDVEEDDPNLVKIQVQDSNTNNLRPVPPQRPPPSPKSARPPSPLPKSSRSPSPLTLPNSTEKSKAQVSKTEELAGPCYDYADPNRVSPRLERKNSHNSNSSKVNTSDQQTSDNQPSYDYADISDEDERRESVYEDVDSKLREASMKKHKSEADLVYNLSGYEVPVTSKSRPNSSPENDLSVQNVDKPKNTSNNPRVPLKPPTAVKPNTNGKPIDLKSELQSKLLQKPGNSQLKPSGVNSGVKKLDSKPVSTNNDVVKSDNTATKDYEKAPDKKSVLNMAQVFEQKKQK